MNTDDNEQYLARLAMGKAGITELGQKAFAFEQRYGVYNAPAVKGVKGFDASAAKAERAKTKRARKLAKRLERVGG